MLEVEGHSIVPWSQEETQIVQDTFHVELSVQSEHSFVLLPKKAENLSQPSFSISHTTSRFDVQLIDYSENENEKHVFLLAAVEDGSQQSYMLFYGEKQNSVDTSDHWKKLGSFLSHDTGLAFIPTLGNIVFEAPEYTPRPGTTGTLFIDVARNGKLLLRALNVEEITV